MKLPFAIMVLCVGACGATEYFVDRTRPDDSGAGTSEQTAFKTIQAAVAKAGNNDIVTVLPGEYAETPITVEVRITETNYGIPETAIIEVFPGVTGNISGAI